MIRPRYTPKLALIAATALMGFGGTATAETFNVYGDAGFVLQNHTTLPLTQPDAVAPHYAFNLGTGHLTAPLGIIDNSDLQLYKSISTANGNFAAPLPVTTSIDGTLFDSQTQPSGVWGSWQQQFNTSQVNQGVYFAGKPSSLTGPFDESLVTGDYGGTAVGWVRNGYETTAVSGCVTVAILGTTSFHVLVTINLIGNEDTFQGSGAVDSIGISFSGNGHASTNFINEKWEGHQLRQF